jgi:hypothetical protein
MFVLANGTVDEYRAEPGQVDFVLPLEPGAEPDSLLAETSRRIRVLAALPARNGRDRIVAATGAVQPGVRLGEGQDEILALADGRRTARDLAFALGYGVYATILQVARMQQAGLLVVVSSRAADAAAAQIRRPAAASDLTLASGLPRRQRDVPAPPRRPWAPGRAPELLAPLGLLRPRAARDTGPGETT